MLMMHMYGRFQGFSYTLSQLSDLKISSIPSFPSVCDLIYIGDPKGYPILAELRDMSPAKNTNNAPESKTKQDKKSGSKTPVITALHMHIQFLFKKHCDPLW